MAEKAAGSTPLEVTRYMEGLKFPAFKSEILQHARDKDAPDNVMGVLEELPDQEYFRMADIIPEFEEGDSF